MKHSFELKGNEDRIIRGDVFRSKQPSKGILLIAHGYKGFKDWGMFPHAAEVLSEWLDVILFNFSMNGVGESLLDFTELEKFAHNTYSRELEDLDQVVRAVKSGTFDKLGIRSDAPLMLLGHSRGGGVSLIYAFDYPESVNGVISWNGITHVDLFSEQQKREMREKGRSAVLNGRTNQQMPLDKEILDDMELNAKRFNIIERARSAAGPIVLIQGTEDSERLRKGSEALVAINPQIQWLQVPGGNHTFGAVHPFRGETSALREALALTKNVILNWLGEA